MVIAARLNLRLRVQKRRFLNSDYLMCASWVSAIFVAALDIKLSLMGVLDPDVGEDLENYPGNEEETVLAIKVRILATQVILIVNNCWPSAVGLTMALFRSFGIVSFLFSPHYISARLRCCPCTCKYSPLSCKDEGCFFGLSLYIRSLPTLLASFCVYVAVYP